MLPRNLVAALLAVLFGLALTSPPATVVAAESDQVKAQEKTYDAHRQYLQIHFDDDEMDFALQWLLGSTPFGGCEIGEAFRAAGDIKDGDPESWQKGWLAMARRLEKRAEQSLQNGHKVSAREAFCRASNYYRTALVSKLPDQPDFKQVGLKSRECLRRAGPLFDPPVEYFEVPFEGTVLPGYFWRADKAGDKAKTIIMVGGGETHIEDTFFYLAPAAHRRGYNYLTVDIPGQGLLPLEGKFYRPDAETALMPVIDYALTRPEVDAQRLAMYGISGGGYFVPRTATRDKRIKALAVNSAVVDQGKVFANMPVAQATPQVLAKWPAFKRQTAGVVAWRWGLATDNVAGLVKANQDFVYDPAQVTCPALILIGEGEYANQEIKRQQHLFYDSIATAQKELVITPADVGAASHCMGENRSVMSQVLFDWLDEVLR